jgi:hypothetical protein
MVFGQKFVGDLYAEWPNVIEALANCTALDNYGAKWGGRDSCLGKLNCALNAADSAQQAQYSAAATILGLVSSPK